LGSSALLREELSTTVVERGDRVLAATAMGSCDPHRLADPDFYAETLRGAQAVRARIERDLDAALAAGELRSATDVATLATLVETTYHGAMIGWAIHRENTLADWLRDQVEAVLGPPPNRELPPLAQDAPAARWNHEGATTGTSHHARVDARASAPAANSCAPALDEVRAPSPTVVRYRNARNPVAKTAARPSLSPTLKISQVVEPDWSSPGFVDT